MSAEQAANLVKLLDFALSNYVKNNGQLRAGGAIDMDLLANQVEAQSVKLPQ
jgi:hypothetical protein